MDLRSTEGKALVRVLTAVVAIPVLLLLTWAPQLHFVFSLAVMALAGVGLYEFYAMARARDLDVEGVGGIAFGVLVVFAAHWGRFEWVGAVFCLACGAVAGMHVLGKKHSLPGMAASLLGLVYVAWLGAHVVLLRSHVEVGMGRWYVTALFVSVMLADSGAYLVGSLIGRHKLAPRVSPHKTWEGAVGGVVSAVLGMALYWYVARRFPSAGPSAPLVFYLVIGVVLAVASQLGDLTESLMKRDAGVKDSGSFFPGHGGVLDRCDGLLFAAPVLYYALVVLDSLPGGRF